MNVETQPHSVQFCRTAVSVYTRWRVTNDPPHPAIYPRRDLSVAVAFTWPKRAEVVAPWRSLNFYSGFMRFACRRRPEGGAAGRGGDLMMMYRGRAAERRENGRGRVLPRSMLSRQRKESLNTKRGRKRKKEQASWRNTRYDSPGGGAIFHSLFARYLIVERNTHVPSGLLPKFWRKIYTRAGNLGIKNCWINILRIHSDDANEKNIFLSNFDTIILTWSLYKTSIVPRVTESNSFHGQYTYVWPL